MRISMYIRENQAVSVYVLVCITVKMTQWVCMRVNMYICEKESVSMCTC